VERLTRRLQPPWTADFEPDEVGFGLRLRHFGDEGLTYERFRAAR
jgi:hypothetical protein